MPRSSVGLLLHLLVFLGWYTCSSSGKIGGWDTSPNTQYHIQTDEGPERFFRYQTMSGQYRKEKRLQDGSVVGTYGWVDADGYLRLRDYIADDKGYRIVRTKMVRVGQQDTTPQTPTTTTTTTVKPPITLSDYLREKQQEDLKVDVVPNGIPSSTPSPVNDYIRPTTYRPYYNPNSLDQRAFASEQQPAAQQVYAVPQRQEQQVYAVPQRQEQQVYAVPQRQEQQVYAVPQQEQQQVYQNQGYQQQTNSNQEQQPYSEPALYNEPYDGVATTQNGFRYYLPRQYHEEETLAGERRAGSFGYVDPFGIRRVIYYNTAPGSGFVHRKNNRYVGFNSTPYDPRF